MSNIRNFVINCEFEVSGKNIDNVVTTCPQLNLHTEGRTIQDAMTKLSEAILFFFDTFEERGELNAAIDELMADDTDSMWIAPL